MTTSGTTIYELSRDSIIKAAMRKVAALSKGQTPDATDLANGQEALNALVAEFQTLGMPLWARKDYTITLVAGQRDYTIGVGQTIATPFPLRMQKVVLETISGGSTRDLIPVAYQDFVMLNTESSGPPVNYSYQPKINIGVLSVWPLPDTVSVSTYSLKITYQRPFEGFTAASETPDFPQEWQNALIYNLAVSLAPEFGVPLEDRKVLKDEAKQHLETALQSGVEEASMYFQREVRG